MARGFKLDETGDSIISKTGKITFTSGADLKRQTIETILKTNKGEWFLNPTEGINFRAILGKNVSREVVREEVLSGIRQVEETLNLVSFSTKDQEGRCLRVKFKAQNPTEEIEGGSLYAR